MSRPVLALLLLAVTASAYQLEVSPSNPCVARGNGTCFDFSSMFSYPVHFNVSSNGGNPGTYEYWYSPCEPVKCDGYNKDVAVCQRADQFYDAGSVNPLYLWNGARPDSGESANLTILFPGGTTWRNTLVTVVEADVTPATIQMTGEDPFLQYNFLIRSKTLGLSENYEKCEF